MSLYTMIRRALMRGLKDEPVQTVRVQVYDDLSRDAIERLQDYGFAAVPVEGEGVVIECGGHMMVLRMDRIDDRPALSPWDVCVWHKDGHKITLATGGKIAVDCTDFVVNASGSVQFNTPTVSASEAIRGQTLHISGSGSVDGINIGGHSHNGVKSGGEDTGSPNRG